jgi:hypothetical protein
MSARKLPIKRFFRLVSANTPKHFLSSMLLALALKEHYLKGSGVLGYVDVATLGNPKRDSNIS